MVLTAVGVLVLFGLFLWGWSVYKEPPRPDQIVEIGIVVFLFLMLLAVLMISPSGQGVL